MSCSNADNRSKNGVMGNWWRAMVAASGVKMGARSALAGTASVPGSAPMRCSSARKAASWRRRSASSAAPSSAISSAARANR
ncbi:Uncharacterised protein [Bordetella pertussis]|nr:Uncharacterised protein [Bordetella pertussis]